MTVPTPQWIRNRRRRLGWTQAELAAAVGTDLGTVSRWERGVATPRPGSAARLRQVLVSPAHSLVEQLIKNLGRREAILRLRKQVLLACRPPRVRFACDPAERLREVDRLYREQTALMRRARPKKR